MTSSLYKEDLENFFKNKDKTIGIKKITSKTNIEALNEQKAVNILKKKEMNKKENIVSDSDTDENDTVFLLQ